VSEAGNWQAGAGVWGLADAAVAVQVSSAVHQPLWCCGHQLDWRLRLRLPAPLCSSQCGPRLPRVLDQHSVLLPCLLSCIPQLMLCPHSLPPVPAASHLAG
jgi:hypothetical protein